MTSGLHAPGVLFVDHTAELGGAELFLLDLARRYPADRRVVLFSDGPLRSRLEAADVPVEVLAGSRSVLEVRRDGGGAGLATGAAVFRLAVRLARRARGADVLFANSQKALVVGALAAALARRPLVWYLHDILSAEHFSAGHRRLVVALANRFASRVVCNSEATREAFVAAGGKEEKTSVVYNGIDPAPFDEVSEADARRLRDELDLGDGPVVGVFSRLAEWKGQHVLLDALASVPGAQALLVGDALFPADHAYAERLRERASEPDLAGRVRFVGFRDDVPALMKACDVLAHTSVTAEPFGRVIVEGMLAGRPVVASDAGGAREIVRDGKTGRLVTPGDPAALAAALSDMTQNPERTRTLSVTARGEALRRFSPEAMIRGVVRAAADAAAGPPLDGWRSALGPEALLLVDCFRETWPSDGSQTGKALPDGETWEGDWDRFFELVYQHRASRAAYHGLLKSDLPAEIARRLRIEAMQASALGLGTVQDLDALLERFGDAEIPVIPLKGPVLSEVLYGDTGTRLSSDLDIVVRPEDLGRARALLVQMGYESPHNEVPDDVLLQTEKDSPFFRPGHVPVEVHWALFESYHNFQFPTVWRRLEDLSLGTRRVQSLPWDVYLVYLCVHGSKHVWRRLSWIADIARLLETRDPEVALAAEDLARRFQSERMLLLGVALADALFGAPAPPALLRRARGDRAVRALVRQVLSRQIDGDPIERFDEAWFLLRMRDSVVDVPRYLRHLTELAAVSSRDLSPGRRAIRATARGVLALRRLFLSDRSE